MFARETVSVGVSDRLIVPWIITSIGRLLVRMMLPGGLDMVRLGVMCWRVPSLRRWMTIVMCLWRRPRIGSVVVSCVPRWRLCSIG